MNGNRGEGSEHSRVSTKGRKAENQYDANLTISNRFGKCVWGNFLVKARVRNAAKMMMMTVFSFLR